MSDKSLLSIEKLIEKLNFLKKETIGKWGEMKI